MLAIVLLLTLIERLSMQYAEAFIASGKGPYTTATKKMKLNCRKQFSKDSWPRQ